jgi:type I restriction enzyme, S subunit
MSNNNKNKLAPKLRFPDFAKDEEWILSKLGNVYSFITTNSFSRDDLNYIKGKVKNIHYGDIHTKFSTLFDITRENVPFINESIPLDKFKRVNYCKERDMIFADASEDLKDVGKSIELVNLNNEKVLSGLHTILARQINDEIVVGFGGYLFLNDKIRKQIQRESQGAKVLGISATRLSDISIFYPQEKKEQQKIAACLSSLDDLMTSESQKLEVLIEHKKGLLQNLFPHEGETVPKLRFKEFEYSGEWALEAINNLTPINEKYGIVDGPFGSNLKTIHYKSEGIPIITSGYVTEGLFSAKSYLYVTKEKFNEEKRSAVRGGDIVMAKIGARCGASAIMPINHQTGILSGNALKITIDESRFSTNFVWQQLWYLHLSEKLNGLKSIGAQPAISMDSLKKFKLLVPVSLKEQKIIASCLSSLDDLINAQKQKIEALNLHKKGLLQGLFPNINEII